MASDWNRARYTKEDIDFYELFESQNMTPIKFLHHENIVGQCKDQTEMATKVLIEYQNVLKGLIDVCLRPEHYAKQNDIVVTTQHTHKAIQILADLNAKLFGKYLFGITINTAQPQEQQIKDMIEQKIQEPIPLQLTDCPFKYLFNVLFDSKQLTETVLNYLCRIFYLCCGTFDKQIIQFFMQNNQILEQLFLHFYSEFVADVFLKVLEYDDANAELRDIKIKMFMKLTASLDRQVRNNQWDKYTLLCIFKNYEYLIVQMRQQEQNFYRLKFTALNMQLCAQRFPIQFLIDYINTNTFQILQEKYEQLSAVFRIIQKYLHMDISYKPCYINNVNNSISSKKQAYTSQNLSDAKSSSHNQSKVDTDIKINPQIRTKLKTCLQVLCKKLAEKKIIFDRTYLNFNTQFLKLLKTILLIQDPNQSQFIQNLATPVFISYLLDMFVVFKNSTILHNFIKDILIIFLLKNSAPILEILFNQKKSNFLQLVREMDDNCNTKQKQYQNQLYLIYQMAKQKLQASQLADYLKQDIKDFQALEQKIATKQIFYSTQIGGNAKKLGLGQLGVDYHNQNDSHSPRRYNQDIILSPNTFNDVIIGNTQHWIENQLRLESDSSKDQVDYHKSSQNIQGSMEAQQNENQSQLCKRLRNLGVAQYQQRQIRITTKKDRYNQKLQNNNLKVEQRSKQKQVSRTSSQKQLKDKDELELERQIQILQSKRLHLQQRIDRNNSSEEILPRLNKQIDSLQQQPKQEQNYQESLIPKIGSSVHLIFDTSADNEKKSPSLIQFQQQKPRRVLEQQSILRNSVSSNKSKEAKNHKNIVKDTVNEPEQIQEYINHFPTYLQYQISSILQQMD